MLLSVFLLIGLSGNSIGTIFGTLARQEPKFVPIELNVGEASGFPGAEFTLPIELSAPAEVMISEIVLKLALPEITTFGSVERSYMLQEAEGFITGVAAAEDTRAVTITIRPGTRPLPRGVLGYLVLGVARNAPLGEHALKSLSVSVRAGAGAGPEPAKPSGGRLMVIDPKSNPIAACFFYMH